MSRLRPAAESTLSTLAVIAGVAIVLSLFTVESASRVAAPVDGPIVDSTDPVQLAVHPTADASAAGTTVGSPSELGQPAQPSATDAPGPVGTPTSGTSTSPVETATGLRCARGSNGGATDVGVTGDKILLAATVVDDGPGATFLRPVRTAMVAKVNDVNRKGGVCGRQLDLTLRNDSWDAPRGKGFIQRFVEQDKVFALAVVPSSEGLRSADQYIQDNEVPVVGTDGMLIHQYLNPWIWPVATSTISTMHIIAKEAADRGATEFGIVFDAKYHFGVEGAYAFNQAVKRLTGSDIQGYDPSLGACIERFCGIQPDGNYTTVAHDFDSACYPGCDFVAYLLEPDAANGFISKEARTANTRYGYGLAQPLFNRAFAEGCGKTCDGMRVWTGYRPPLEVFLQSPEMQAYIDTVQRESSSVDVTNQFLEGGYVGMSLLVEALRQVGPNLTRDRLAQVLNSMTFDSGLAAPLTWTADSHFANRSAIGFEIKYSDGFNGWRQATDFIEDPWVGQDIPATEL